MTPRGRFLARACGESRGGVLLRKRQYRLSDSEAESCLVARNFVLGKVYNSRWSIDRTLRDHALRVDAERLEHAERLLDEALPAVAEARELGRLRGLEGVAANAYFGVFDDLILNQKEHFFFRERSRRPPLDNVNALLSFAYSLLASDCAAAAESAGLDSYVGFLHRDRPGRASLALDMMEELRSIFADRFVLTLINNRIVQDGHFEARESGAVVLTEAGRKVFLIAWQNRKKEELTHPFLKEKLPWGLVPYVQALLLASFLRGDLDGYPPFLWK
jgi:CRISPR-associated protein Cas1